MIIGKLNSVFVPRLAGELAESFVRGSIPYTLQYSDSTCNMSYIWQFILIYSLSVRKAVFNLMWISRLSFRLLGSQKKSEIISYGVSFAILLSEIGLDRTALGWYLWLIYSSNELTILGTPECRLLSVECLVWLTECGGRGQLTEQ